MLPRKRREPGWSEGGRGSSLAAGSRASYDGDVMFWVTVGLLVLLCVVGLLSVLRVGRPEPSASTSLPQQVVAIEEVSQEEAKVEARRPTAAEPQIRDMAPSLQLYRLSDETFEEKYTYMDLDKDTHDPKNDVTHSRSFTRTYVIHIPKNVKAQKRPVPMLLCFHGMSRTAWYTAINETSWVEKANMDNFIVVFPQSMGEHDRWGGYTSWDIEGNFDVGYIQALVRQLLIQYQGMVDERRIYAIGLSNGGIFLSQLMANSNSQLAAACNYMGGYVVGVNQRVEGDQGKTPLLVIVGDKDGMLPLARDAESVFREAGHHVEFDLVPDMGHEYRKEKEDSIWSFLSRYQRR